MSQQNSFYRDLNTDGNKLTDKSGSSLTFSDAVTGDTTLAQLRTGTTSLVTVGTITTGTWNGSAIDVAHGGTGVATLASNGLLYGNGAGVVQVTAQGGAHTILVANNSSPSFSAAPIVQTSLQVGDVGTATGSLIFANASTSFSTIINASTSTAATITYSLPVNAPAANGYPLTSTTAGVMSWGGAVVAGGGTGVATLGTNAVLTGAGTSPIGSSTKFTFDGTLATLNQNAASLTAGILGTVLQLSQTDGSTPRLVIDSFANSANIDLRRADGTAASKSGLTLGNTIGNINFLGYGTTAYATQTRATIAAVATEAWTDTANGTALTFSVTSTGTTSPVERARVNQTGLLLGTTSSVTGVLQLAHASSVNLTNIQAGNAAAARTYTWPTDFGAAGSALTDAAGNGTLSWVVPAGGTVTGSGAANRTAYWSSSTALTSSATNTFDGSLMTLNQNAAALTAGFAGDLLHLANVDGTVTRMTFDSFAALSNINFRRANTTAASKSALAADDQIGSIIWTGYGTTGYSATSRVVIAGLANQTWTDSNQGSYLTFSTTANNTTSILERMRIGNDGLVTIQAVTGGIGNIGSLTNWGGTLLQISNADSTTTRVVVDSFAAQGSLSFRRANTTAASKSALAANDQIGNISWAGYGSTAYANGPRATISAFASEVWSDTAHGTYLTLNTTANTTATNTERMRIDNAGFVGVNATSLTSQLQVAQAATTSGVTTLALFTGAANTGITAGTEVNNIYFNIGQTYQWASNTTVALQRFFRIAQPTIAFASATGTVTTAATFQIDGAPSSGTNAIISGSVGLRILAGATLASNASGQYFLQNLGGGTVTFTGNTHNTISTAPTSMLRIGQLTIASDTSGYVMDKVAMVNLGGAPTTGTNTTLTESSIIDMGDAGATMVSASGMLYSGLKLNAHTVTLTGTTQVTGTPSVAGVRLGQITITDGSSVTVDNAATLYIAAAPVAAGSVTLTNAYALWSAAGKVRLDSSLVAISQTTGGVGNLTAGATGTILQLAQADSTVNRVYLDAFAASNAIHFRRADGTAASKSALAAADETIGQIRAEGYGSTGYSASQRAALLFFSSQTWTDNNQGTYIVFQTTVNGTGSGTPAAAEHLRIDAPGNLITFGIGSALATSATDGFLYLTTMAGTPTGDSTDYTGRLPIVYDSTGNKLWVNTTSTTWLPFASSPGTKTTTFATGTNTWTKSTNPAPISVEVICVGAGGGGGGGEKLAASLGGGGGGGGSVKRAIFKASDLGSTETVTIGAAGTAGTNAPTAGGDGGTASFGSWLKAWGGGGGEAASISTATSRGGGGASSAASGAGNAGGAPAVGADAIDIQGTTGGSNAAGFNSSWGGASGGGATATTGSNGGSSLWAAPGGAAGGASTGANGGAGGATGSYVSGGGGTAGTGGASPTAGGNGTAKGTSSVGPYCGQGGGGGGGTATAAATAGAGGNGGLPGGGGGGGGSCLATSTAAGAGGTGGAGQVVVIEYF